MRQSKECGNDLDDGADKARATIKTALVKLDIDIGGFVGMICQFADEETFTGSYRLNSILDAAANSRSCCLIAFLPAPFSDAGTASLLDFPPQ